MTIEVWKIPLRLPFSKGAPPPPDSGSRVPARDDDRRSAVSYQRLAGEIDPPKRDDTGEPQLHDLTRWVAWGRWPCCSHRSTSWLMKPS